MSEEKKNIKEMTFREAMDELNRTVELLEGDTLELEESLEKYKHGVVLLAHLKGELNNAQVQVEELMGKIEAEGRKSVMEGVPTALPSLVKSIRIQEKAAGIGFPSQRGEQLKKELLPEGEDDEAWGELLFDLVAEANKRGINVDNALEKAKGFFH